MFNSGFEARYPFSTDKRAAAAGFVSTHFAALSKARVAAAAGFPICAALDPAAPQETRDQGDDE